MEKDRWIHTGMSNQRETRQENCLQSHPQILSGPPAFHSHSGGVVSVPDPPQACASAALSADGHFSQEVKPRPVLICQGYSAPLAGLLYIYPPARPLTCFNLYLFVHILGDQFFVCLYLSQGLTLYPGLALNLQSFCLNFCSAEITSMHHHTQLAHVFELTTDP